MTMNTKKSTNNIVHAVRSDDGFIEITSIDALNKMVGGMLDPNSMFCQFEQAKIPTQTIKKQTA